ncbi:MAG: hypothetical protein ACE5G0_05615 [Rhodothermales bacterium]
MSLSFGLSPWLLALCVLIAAGLTYWTYRRTVPRVSTARRAVLMTLRFVALFIVLFLLFEPIWRQLQRDERPPVLAVVVDDSQSLGLEAETEGEPLDLAAATRRTLRSVPFRSIDGQTRFFAFSNSVRALPRSNDAADSLHFDGVRTNIAQALNYIRDELQDQNLRGVLLISDGQYNTGRNPLYQAERYPVPIHTVAVGDTLRRRDLQIRRVTTNEIAYVNDELPVQVGLRSEGFGGERVVVSLFQNGRLLDSAPIELPEGTSEAPVDLSYTPALEGFQQLSVSVTQLSGEVTFRNNTESFMVRVLKSKRRILLLGAAPDPDLSNVRQLLEQDDNTEVVSFVQKGPGSFYEGSFPATLDDIDLMVLVGYPGRSADRRVLQRVAAASLSGTPLLFLLTRQTDLAVLRANLQDVLPALPARSRPGFSEASFVATPRGEQHPIMEIPERPPSFNGLPPLLYNASRWETSPDARVLATIDMRGVPLDDPLLVIRRRTGSRSAALLGSGTWRWKNLPDDLATYASFWPALFSNLTQWLTTPEDDRRVRVEPIRELFSGGEAIEFTGQVYDESLNPVGDARLALEVTASDSTTFPYTMEPVGNGRYVLDIGTLPEGTYHYRAEAERNGARLGEDTGSFVIGALTIEFKETRANAALLRQIAQRSGGTFFTPDDLQELPATLARSGSFAPLLFEEVREMELWRLPFFVLLVVLLLTTEWVVRKRSGMV